MTTLILGAGLAGLGAARALHAADRPFRVLEREDGPGGLARSFQLRGYSFDRTGHYLHSQTPFLEDALRDEGVRMDAVQRSAGVLVGRNLVDYPIQYNLWGLPEAARQAMGALQGPETPPQPPQNFAEQLLASWGPELCALFFHPYNRKLWGRDLDQLPPDCAGQYMPVVDWDQVSRGLLGPTSFAGYNGAFRYPHSGRFGDAAEALAAPLRASIDYEWTVQSIDLERRVVTSAAGAVVPFDDLITTVPLPMLLRLLGRPIDKPELFTSTAIRNVRVGFVGRALSPHQWLYAPDSRATFYRVGMPVNVNPATCPPGCAALSIECGVFAGVPPVPIDEVVSDAIGRLTEAGAIDVEDIQVTHEITLDPAYVVFRSAGRPAFDALRQDLAAHRVYLAGRYGTWDYLSMDQAYKSGMDACAQAGRARGALHRDVTALEAGR